ncbi:hypothetical protein D9619_008986 [Psilocybe cf. subviscida]|uniref:Pentacotripeptide-repeat region of PRORP domain-containing protein n=1 Tax=Psilocybe cf. subviscida TaxID=2480587 RepID=A0A8H5BUM6_9AGAR|nr:hypothetical protein D9619_008986 [Psilocybe cf. subviscida]
MSYSALPPALVDLTLLRLTNPKRISAGSLNRWRRAYQTSVLDPSSASASSSTTQLSWDGLKRTRRPPKRKSVAGPPARAVTPAPAASSLQLHDATSQLPMTPLEELEKRVGALDDVVEAQATTPVGSFFYSEDELLAIYEDVLAVPEAEVEDTAESNRAALEAVRRAEEMEDQRLLEGLRHRLLDDVQVDDSVPMYRRVLARAHEIFARVEAARNAVNPEGSREDYVPLALISIREYEALIREAMKTQDVRAATVAQEMMKGEKMRFPPQSLTNILSIYASAGEIKSADDLLVNFLKEAPTEDQRHLHIKAHLRGTPEKLIPTSAMELLHYYEDVGMPAPMQTYGSVITSLLSRPSSTARAQAWDIFAHMRYAAHPNPDASLYTTMIRACAYPVSVRYSSEPEKALDLWTEMTVDHKLRPTVASYNAVILACARSGTKTYVNEAFRLARQMLDANRDARGFSAYRPDRKTFCALLEGAKRIGDLARTRWILAEMIRQRGDDLNAVETQIDEEVMMHVFNAYASYKPPLTREATVFVKNKSENATGDETTAVDASSSTGTAVQPNLKQSSSASSSTSSSSSPAGPSSSMVAVDPEEDELASAAFTMRPPQTREEVIREVRMLFGRIVGDIKTASSPQGDMRKFSGVRLSSRLFGAYLSVFYRHTHLETSMELFETFVTRFPDSMSPRVYVEALERCGNARRGRERDIVVACLDSIWARWEPMENAAQEKGEPLSARYVERAHIAKIRTLAMTENTDRAMEHLRAFAAKYPPDNVRTPALKPAFRSTRSQLVANRPLVRMTSASEVPDDHVPPLATFRDLEILHHRLVDDMRDKDIKYVTWLCKAYEWALRVRRDETVKAKIAPPETPIYIPSH